jgi:hypothetical protein
MLSNKTLHSWIASGQSGQLSQEQSFEVVIKEYDMVVSNLP